MLTETQRMPVCRMTRRELTFSLYLLTWALLGPFLILSFPLIHSSFSLSFSPPPSPPSEVRSNPANRGKHIFFELLNLNVFVYEHFKLLNLNLFAKNHLLRPLVCVCKRSQCTQSKWNTLWKTFTNIYLCLLFWTHLWNVNTTVQYVLHT